MTTSLGLATLWLRERRAEKRWNYHAQGREALSRFPVRAVCLAGND